MFTYELARRLEGTGVTATALHPGMTNTGFGAEDTARGWGPLIAVMRPFMKKPAQGAETSVYLASSPDAEGLTGRTSPIARPRTSHKASYDTRDHRPAVAGQRRARRRSCPTVGRDDASGGQGRGVERETGFEPATFCLGSRHSAN